MKKLTLLFWVATLVPHLSALAVEIEVAKDITYLEDAKYPDNKDKLDLYIPAGDGPSGGGIRTRETGVRSMLPYGQLCSITERA